MTTKGAKKYFTNPVIGLCIGVIYILCLDFTKDIELSLVISIACGLVYDIWNRFYTRTKLGSIFCSLTIITLVLTLLLNVLLKKYDLPSSTYMILFEVLMVTILILTRLSRSYIIFFLGTKQRPIEKALIGEFIETTKLVEYAFTFHLFAILIYHIFENNFLLYEGFEIIFYNFIPVAILLTVIVYQEVKTNSIAKQLRKEEWLPIVTESGEVTGRIARSVSEHMGNHFLHPVIRVVVIHEGKIYLQKRPENDLVDSGHYDHPLEEYMPYGKEINQAVNEYLYKKLKIEALNFNFLLKYVYDNDNSKRLIFLFVVRIENQEQLDSLRTLHGKFWSTQQIEEEFIDDTFYSECFQLEYEYLKNTIIESEQLRRAYTN